jgi:hypothetical protein
MITSFHITHHHDHIFLHLPCATPHHSPQLLSRAVWDSSIGERVSVFVNHPNDAPVVSLSANDSTLWSLESGVVRNRGVCACACVHSHSHDHSFDTCSILDLTATLDRIATAQSHHKHDNRTNCCRWSHRSHRHHRRRVRVLHKSAGCRLRQGATTWPK